VTNSNFYTKQELAKLGNALIFFCEQLSPATEVSKTHLLKLVFILEEMSVKKFGLPFFNLRFEVWKLGPVSQDLFVELTDEPDLLAGYITREQIAENRFIIRPLKPFSDDEFSDLELDLMQQVADRFKFCTAKELINFTHRKESPWYITAQRHGLVESLESGKINTTNIEIDLSELIQDEAEKLSRFRMHQEFIQQSKSLKS
jgi:uncharacterized phage-associated protein